MLLQGGQTNKQMWLIPKGESGEGGKTRGRVLIWAFKELVAPPPSYVLLMLSQLKPGLHVYPPPPPEHGGQSRRWWWWVLGEVGREGCDQVRLTWHGYR